MELPQVQSPGSKSLQHASEANKLIRPLRGLMRAEFSPAGGSIIPGEEKWIFQLPPYPDPPSLPDQQTVVVFCNGAVGTMQVLGSEPTPIP